MADRSLLALCLLLLLPLQGTALSHTPQGDHMFGDRGRAVPGRAKPEHLTASPFITSRKVSSAAPPVCRLFCFITDKKQKPKGVKAVSKDDQRLSWVRGTAHSHLCVRACSCITSQPRIFSGAAMKTSQWANELTWCQHVIRTVSFNLSSFGRTLVSASLICAQ